MKNIKVSDEIHKEIVNWCDHKKIKITDIINKLINTGLMTEKYGLSFFQTIIEKEGYISKNKQKELENKLKQQFYEKGHKEGHELGVRDGIKELQKQKDKLQEVISEKIITKEPEKKEEIIEPIKKETVKEIPQYIPDDIYGDEKNTRFTRLDFKRNKK